MGVRKPDPIFPIRTPEIIGLLKTCLTVQYSLDFNNHRYHLKIAHRERGQQMTRRAALYLRVSTDKQTVQNQELQLRQVAERRGWEVVEVYSDAGISGSKGRADRPGLDQMLNAVSRRHFDIVLV